MPRNLFTIYSLIDSALHSRFHKHLYLPYSKGMTDLSTLSATDRPHRLENPRLVSGQGLYVHNLQFAGMQHTVFVRSDYAFAKLLNVEVSAALSAPGVLAVLTAQDLGHPTLPGINPLLPQHNQTPFAVLATDCVHYVGQPIVLLVAHTLRQAQDAAALVSIEYESLADSVAAPTFYSHFTSGEPSQAFDPSLSSDSSANNAAAATTNTTATIAATAASNTSIDTATATANTITTHITCPRVSAMTMEPRACVARWQDSTLTCWLGTQTPTRAQTNLAQALNIDASQVHVITQDVGGAFGAKSSIYPEEIAVALAARHLQTTICWAASRSEEFVSAYQGRGAHLQGQLTVSDTGQLMQLSAQIQTELGAWLSYSAAIPLHNSTRILPGPYRVKQLNIQGQASRSHTASVNIYRGAGRPEATLLIETLIEKATRAIGFDPVELRRLNIINAQDMPYVTPTGNIFDSGDFAATLSLACDKFDYFAQRTEQQRRKQHGEVVGIGVALYVEPCGQGWESASVTLHDAQRATIASGTPAQGQGHATTFIDLAAQALVYDRQHIDINMGDSSTCPPGVGTLASRSMAIGGSALLNACTEALAKRDQGAPFPITVSTRFESKETWSNGCVMVRVKLDPDTGTLKIEQMVWADDAGNILNPTLAYDQLIGGAAQGLGQALMEALRYDEHGQLITGSLMDYAIPRAQDMPNIDVYSLHTPSTTNPLGAKGVGEAGCIGVPAAIMNAVRDALFTHLGQEPPELNFPLTSETIWRAMGVRG
jgi:carbon-monoxide dehydrogenase large subunit